MKKPSRPAKRFYCPGCGEVRTLDRLRDGVIFPHKTGSPMVVPGIRRDCPGGQPDQTKDRVP